MSVKRLFSIIPSYRRAEAEQEIQRRSSACSQQPSYRRTEEVEGIQRRSSACSQSPPRMRRGTQPCGGGGD